MSFEVLYWHWIVFGIFLVMIEIAVPSFTALWFGLGAISVGLLLFISPAMSLTFQISLWALLSFALTLLWFKFLKPKKVSHTGANTTDAVGETGLVIIKPLSTKNGKVRFSTPVLGLDEWEFSTSDDVDIGDMVQVIDIQNNVLITAKK